MRWKIIDRALQYQGFFRLECLQVCHSLYGGGWSNILRHELFQRSDGVAVLPYDPVLDQVLLIEQFRVGAMDSRQDPWLTEIIAGLIEPGERREEVAHREAFEETGCELRELRHVCDYYSSPGAFGERVSVYIARADLESVAGVHGLSQEGEDIRVSKVSAPAAFEMVASGAIASAMPIIALQWLQINYERIRELWGYKRAASWIIVGRRGSGLLRDQPGLRQKLLLKIAPQMAWIVGGLESLQLDRPGLIGGVSDVGCRRQC